MDQGKTERRHIAVHAIQYIGKEANKWEEQFFTGLDVDEQVVYGANAESLDVVIQAIKKFGIKRMAEVAKISVRHVHNIYHGIRKPADKTIAKLLRAGAVLEME